MNVKGAGELGLLARIKPYLTTEGIPVAAGDDDAAVFTHSDGFTVASCDMFVEGVHFDLGWMSARDVGWRSLALSLGDLAAKGASPAWALTSIALPDGWSIDDLVRLYEGMSALAAETGLLMAGGDTSSIEGPAVLSITVVGHTSKRPLARSEARPGWSVAVTGPLGAAAVALREHRSHRLVPLIGEGRRLNELGLCCGDISDGLVREMEKFAAMSGAGCDVRAGDVPRAEGATVEEALTGGEEAELVCVGPAELVEKAGLHVVGELTQDSRVNVAGVHLESTGYDHFGR